MYLRALNTSYRIILPSNKSANSCNLKSFPWVTKLQNWSTNQVDDTKEKEPKLGLRHRLNNSWLYYILYMISDYMSFYAHILIECIFEWVIRGAYMISHSLSCPLKNVFCCRDKDINTHKCYTGEQYRVSLPIDAAPIGMHKKNYSWVFLW